MPTSYIPNITQLQETNSTTYVDQLGIQLGLNRLQGETASNYLKRLEFASRLRREHPYEGALNEMSLQLGVEPAKYINIELADNQVVTSSIAGVVIGQNPPIPVLTFDADTMWNWRLLSDIVAGINTIVPATLLVADGPAFQIARQSNSFWSFSEAVSGVQLQLSNSGIQVGSELFNQVVPAYTLTSDGKLNFTIEPNDGTTITYNYVITPYNLVGSPIAMIGLTDPEFALVAANSNSSLAYQVREFVQALMLVDRSYWAR